MTRQQWAKAARIAARVALLVVTGMFAATGVWGFIQAVNTNDVHRLILVFILECIVCGGLAVTLTALVELRKPRDPTAEYLRDRIRAQVKGKR